MSGEVIAINYTLSVVNCDENIIENWAERHFLDWSRARARGRPRQFAVGPQSHFSTPLSKSVIDSRAVPLQPCVKGWPEVHGEGYGDDSVGLAQIIDLFHLSTEWGEFFQQEKWSLTACAEMSPLRKGHCSRFPGIVYVSLIYLCLSQALLRWE